MSIPQRLFGNTGLTVSALGLGAGQLGDVQQEDAYVGRLLNTALDLGITLVDTARGYGLSEERIGRHLAHRRAEFVLSTKVGYGIAGHEDWTYGCVRAGIEEALRRLRTDYLDIVHLHSCPRSTLQAGEVLRALHDAAHAGQVRVVAYSGETDALAWAVASGRVGSVEHSLSICDQRVIDDVLPQAATRGLGVIAKRPLANAPWRYTECPKGEYVEEYWWRWKTMALRSHGLAWDALMLRFAAYCPGVHSCIVGTANIDHLRHNVALMEQGPLSPELLAELRQAFKQNDPGWWVGQV